MTYKGLGKVIDSHHSLSYHFTDGIQALNNLKAVIQRVQELWEEHSKDVPNAVAELKKNAELQLGFSDFYQLLDDALSHLKYGIRAHLVVDGSNCDGDVFHCCSFAVGKTCKAGQKHLFKCAECANFMLLPHAVRALMNTVKNTLALLLGDDHEAISDPQGPS
jgi:hypothetical protein